MTLTTQSPNDRKIVSDLERNANTTASSISERTGIHRGTVYRRLKRLIALGVVERDSVADARRQGIEVFMLANGVGADHIETAERDLALIHEKSPLPNKIEPMHPAIYSACLASLADSKTSEQARRTITDNSNFKAAHALD